MHMRSFVRKNACTYVCIKFYEYVSACKHIHSSMRIWMHVGTHTRMYERVCLCMYICMFPCTYVRTYK